MIEHLISAAGEEARILTSVAWSVVSNLVMLGWERASSLLTPQVVTVLAVLFFWLAFASQNRFRDPFRCGNGCFHLPGCEFYEEHLGDRRKVVAPQPSPAPWTGMPILIWPGAAAPSFNLPVASGEPDNHARIRTIMRVGFEVISTIVFPIGVGRSIVRMSEIRRSYEKCECHHAPSCDLGEHRFEPPAGAEGWRFYAIAGAGGYQSPCGRHWVRGKKKRGSSSPSPSEKARI